MKRKKVLEGVDNFFGGVKKYRDSLFKTRDRTKLRRAAYPAAVFIVSLLLSMVKAPMGVYPFGYSVIAASSGGIGTIAAFAGAALATVTMDTGALWQVVILTALVLLRLGACFAKGDFKKRTSLFRRIFRERGYIRVVFAAGAAAAGGCITIIKTESIYYGLFSALLGIGMAALSTASFIFLSDKGADRSKRIAGLAVLSIGVTAALELFALPFSIGAVFAFFTSAYFSYAKNAAVGCAVGFACGIAVGGEYGAAFGSVALVSALLWEYSRVGAVVLSAFCACILSLFGAGLDAISEVIPEITFAAAFTAPLLSLGIIPASLPAFFELDTAIFADSGRGAKNLSERYIKISDSLDSLAKMLCEVSDKMCLPTKSEAGRICTTARAKHCSGCIHERECGGREDALVTSFFNNMAYRLTTQGKVSAKIVPESIARRCYNMDGILETVNSSAKRLSGLSGATRKTRIFASDYSAVAELIREVSQSDGCEKDVDGERDLVRALSEEGFTFSEASVYGNRSRRIFMRGVDPAASSAGEGDIRRCAQRVLGGKLSSPEFSLDGKHISASMHSVPAIKLSSGRYSLQSERDNTSGDSICSFENDEGYYYTLVSDGMGSGREAALTSGISAAFLEKLLSAGCPMRSALELLNCFVRGAEGECFTTVDLMEADLYTGRARFIKSGAAPSFVIRKGQLYRLHSKTVPVGIMRALDAEAVSFDLMEGDTVIMMSDGVTGSYEDCPWLYELLCSGLCTIDSPAAAARFIAEEAAKNTGKDDDITVCVLKVDAA